MKIKMRAEIKMLSSPDVELGTYDPEDDSCFSFLLEAQIGPDNEPGADLFQILVCTPEWIRNEYWREGFVFGRHMLIVLSYDLKQIKAALTNYIGSLESDSWPEIAENIKKIAQWEFEDYQSSIN